MSARPDGDLGRFTAALGARLRADRIAEAALAGTLTGLAGLTVGLLFGAASRNGVLAVSLVLGAAAFAARLYEGRRTWSARAVAGVAEDRLPALRNHLITALELDEHPDRASEAIRRQVRSYAARIVAGAPMAAVHSRRRLAACVAGAAIGVSCATAVWIGVPEDRSAVLPRAGARRSSAADPGIGRVVVTVMPPPYTGSSPQTTSDPLRVDALSGSTVTLRVDTSAPTVTVRFDDTPAPVARAGASAFQARVHVAASGLLSIAVPPAEGVRADGRLLPVVVRPDAPPEVIIERPQADLLLEDARRSVRFAVRARDDLELSTLTLHYTKVTGSGEQYGFAEGELPLAVSRRSPNDWRGELSQPLASLGLQAGDLLVYYARATDRRPGAEPAVSDSFVIEIGKPHAAVAGGFATPPPDERAAISLNALIVKTERLHAVREQLPASALAERAAGLAVEQRMVRSETLFLMGAHGDVEDEEAEAAASHEIQEGRLENRGQGDLRLATRLMSAAERSLILTDTGAALRSQRAALAALQRALSRQRYFLRTVPVRSRIDLSRRLSGDLGGARSWQRQGSHAAPHERTAVVRLVLRDLARLALAAEPSATPSAPARIDVNELARRLLGLDPASPALQQAARSLSRLGDPDTRLSDAARRELLAAVAQSLQPQAHDAFVLPAAPPSFTAGPLHGAFADALRETGGRR